MNNKNNNIFYLKLLGIVAIVIALIGFTYAYFAPQAGGTTGINATVTSNTTDLLTFSINRDISFTVTQALFAQNGENQSGDATATATLTPNNKTGSATMNYYLYLDIESNPTVYSGSNTNHDPELMLQVFDGNNQLVTLTGLGTQKTIKGVTGYDITGVEGLQTLLDNHAISASNNTAAIENWKVVITLINLDVNQNENTGKEINAELIIQRDETEQVSYVYWNDNFSDTTYTSSQVPTGTGLNGTYATREELANAYSLWESNPVYIKTTMVGDTVLGHEACVWDSNNEYCMKSDYWVEGDVDGSLTMPKLKQDVENTLDITLYNNSEESYAATGNYYFTCGRYYDGNKSHVYCYTGVHSCTAEDNGRVYTNADYTNNNCSVLKTGEAYCWHFTD